MSPWLAAARAVSIEIAARHAADVDARARFPREAIDALKARGLLGIMVPATTESPGASLGEVLPICQVLAQACASTAMIFAMHQIQVACILRHAGESAWHRGFLGRLAAEQLLLASATSEATIGGDVRSSVCALEESDGGFSLTKDATVISYADDADGILVTARRSPHAPPSDQVIVVVPRASCSLTRLEGWDTLGMRGTCSNGYRLVAAGDRAQVLAAPFADVSAETMLPTAHLVWSAVWLGIATDAVTRARAFLRETRKRTESPTGAGRLAQAVSLLQVMKSSVAAALRAYEAAAGAPERLSAVSFAVQMNGLKTTTSDMAVEVVDHALRVCGLAGYRNDSPYSVGRHLRDVYSASLMVNNDRILANMGHLLPAWRDELEPSS